jgi:hypothetical protein
LLQQQQQQQCGILGTPMMVPTTNYLSHWPIAAKPIPSREYKKSVKRVLASQPIHSLGLKFSVQSPALQPVHL